MFFGDSAYQINETIQPSRISPDSAYIGLEHIEQETLQLIEIGKGSAVTSNKKIFRKGDILFGKLRPYFRKVVIADFDGICSTDIWVIRPKENIDSKFLYYWCANWEFINFINSASEGTRMPRAKWEVAINHEIPNHTYENQKIIGNILGSLDKKIEINKKTNEIIEEIAKSLFKSWFIDFDPVKAKSEVRSTGLQDELSDLFPNLFEDSKLGKIPKGWSCKPFGKFLTQKKEKIGQRKATVLSAINSGELVPSEKYFSKKVFSKDISNYIAMNKYDIAYNPSRINIGSIGLHNDNYLGAVSPIYIVVTPSQGWHWFTEMSIKRSYFNQNVKVLASGSVRQSLSVDDFFSISVVTPPVDSPLITYFNRFYDLLLKRQNNLKEEIRYLQILSDTLLPKLISGELGVTDAEKMIDEVNF